MSDIVLGKLITGHAERDAIHVALAPVVADEELFPSERIGLRDGRAIRATTDCPAIGIVDPFLTGSVKLKEKFYMMLLQNTVTGMRHEWTHPQFPKSDGVGSRDPEGESCRWLEKLAERFSCGRDDLVERLKIYADDSCGHDDGIQEGLNNLTEIERRDMWMHFERFTGIQVRPGIREMEYFSCSC